ncbi:FHA domain-containing protein FhaB/FipA [Corynebacterium alimapuense]|uniref:FHA domain-containing protein n=1 Tax=Corynebacterium alimapuense TaxID=1576874 RepID=A0A3M8K6M4_9CORY|nr:FHA domain-containing protein [Corynebacterium alimapuense]RNE48154.1 FHA domain-containing protein [Corynebacterium alimapuense]
MDSIVMLVFRIGLLALLWFFVLMALRAMRKDVQLAAGVTSSTMTPAPQLRSAAVIPGRREAARQLTVIDGPLKGSHMEVAALEEAVLGRSPECDFQLGDDYSSGRHARLFRRGSDWFVEDLDSRNGTFVGGYRIDQPERVGVGTDIKVGRTTVRLIP